MNGRAIGVLVRAAWVQQWNRQWRFSRAKAGLWLGLLQSAATALALWRLSGADAAGVRVTPGAAFLLMALQAGPWSFLSVFLNGRSGLYGSQGLPLVHISPAPDYAVPAAQVGINLPRRAWSMLLWALGLGLLVAPGTRWWTLPALWALGILTGSLCQAAGLFVLVAWVRAAPRALAVTWGAVLTLQVGLFYYAVYLVAAGISPDRMAADFGAMRWWLVGGLGYEGRVQIAREALATVGWEIRFDPDKTRPEVREPGKAWTEM